MAVAADQPSVLDPPVDQPGPGARVAGELHAAVEMLVGVDLACCVEGDLEVLCGATQRLRSFAAAADTRIARRREQLWAGQGGGDGNSASASGQGSGDGSGCGDGAGGDAAGGGGAGGAGSGRLGGDGPIGGARDRRGDGDAARDHERARAGELMASFEAALEAGSIDVAHVDAIVVALRRLETDEVRAGFVEREASLLEYAKVERPDRFRRRCGDLVRRLLRDHGVKEAERQRTASRVRQWLNRQSGMGHLHVELDPERYEKFVTALEAKIDELRSRPSNADATFEALRVEAFMELVTASSAVGVRVPEVLVLIDERTLRTGVFGDTSVSETVSGLPLSPEAVRRLACDGGIVPVVMGGAGVPLDVGRKRRCATRAQRQALRAMYTTCAHPQCWRPFSWCRIHHLVWWEFGGDTDLANLLPLCDQHHHQVHEGGWTLSMTPDRVVTWRTPGGTVWFVGDTRDRPPARWDQPPPPPGESPGPGHSPDPGGGSAESGSTCCGGTPSGDGRPGNSSDSRSGSRAAGPTATTSPTSPRTGPPTRPSRTDLAEAVTAAPPPTLPDFVVGETESSLPGHEPRDADAAGEPSWLSGLTPHLRRRWREPRPNDPTLFGHDSEAAGP